MRSNGKVYLDPEPFCKLKTFNSSSIDFFANCWCDSSDYWDVYYYVMEHVYNEFKKKGISIPYAQIEVREKKETVTPPFDPAPLPERVEKERPVPSDKLTELKKHYEETVKRIEAAHQKKEEKKTQKASEKKAAKK